MDILDLIRAKLFGGGEGGGGGASVTIEPLTVTENGTTTAPEGTAYSPVTVDVPNPSAGELEITENGTYDVMEKASAVVKVPQYLGYLTFQNIAYITVATPVWDGDVYISNDAELWAKWDGTRFDSGDSHTIYLRGSGNTKMSQSGNVGFSLAAYDSAQGGVVCDGNIENLLDAETVARGEHPPMAATCFYSLFNGCTELESAPELPAVTLTMNCYRNMFYGCTSLSIAPKLPATTLAINCYVNMFHDCTSLSTAPVLPATTLADGCYSNMFQDCANLTVAPALPATTLAVACYNCMFQGCTSLTATPSLPATTLKSQCYAAMFAGCTSLSTLPLLPATTLPSFCYREMFAGCTNIQLVRPSDANHTTPYRIPASDTGTMNYGALENMFKDTGGSVISPNINLIYYTSNTISGRTKITENGLHNVAQYEYAEVDVPLGYLTFSNIKSLYVNRRAWNGRMYISDDAEQWSVWDGTSFASGDSHTIYLRGDGNSIVSWAEVAQSYAPFIIVVYDSDAGGVACTGNIENLLDAATVARGEHPQMGVCCFAGLFSGCTSLTTAPALPATDLANSCYSGMFRNCTSLTIAPALPATITVPGCYQEMFYGCTKLASLPVLPATTLKSGCYLKMFYGCTNIKLAATSNSEYSTAYRIPISDTGTVLSALVGALSDMFTNTGGTFTGTPTVNTTYYTSNAVPELTKITANGMYNVAQYEYVDVNVPSPALNPLSVTANGTYTPASGAGYGTVTVNVPVPLAYDGTVVVI